VLRRTDARQHPGRTSVLTMLAVLAASIYGGFFTAGMSVLIVAVLGLTSSDTFTRLNALKQMLAFTVNIAAVLFFMTSEHVIWSATVVMAIGALVGGALGGKVATKLNPSILRWIVVAAGASIAIVYLIKDT
jgi:uncharacterized protein